MPLLPSMLLKFTPTQWHAYRPIACVSTNLSLDIGATINHEEKLYRFKFNFKVSR